MHSIISYKGRWANHDHVTKCKRTRNRVVGAVAALLLHALGIQQALHHLINAQDQH